MICPTDKAFENRENKTQDSIKNLIELKIICASTKKSFYETTKRMMQYALCQQNQRA